MPHNCIEISRRELELVPLAPEKEWNWHNLCIDLYHYMHYSEENHIPIEFIELYGMSKKIGVGGGARYTKLNLWSMMN